MAKINESVKMIATLVIIAVVVAAAMAGVNMLTKYQIAQNDVDKLNNSLKEVLPADSYDILQETETATVYEAKKGGQTIGYCVSNITAGYGGDIHVLTGVDVEGKVTKISILSHGETPGLGANATKDAFKNEFTGKLAGTLSAEKNAAGADEIQAISGATITSKAVTKAVNDAMITIKEATR